MLADERQRQYLLLEEIAARMGILQFNLSRFESGEQNPTLDFMIKYATALGMEPDIILKDNPIPPEKPKQINEKKGGGKSNES